jgi:phosphatidylserine/phosphatidylglycerophosphate/cardiolipin synthase-like enzyme
MTEFVNIEERSDLRVKLWRGERMCLIGMDAEEPEPDLVGFSIEVRSPGQTTFQPLRNRLNFSYDKPVHEAVNGFKNFPSTDAPFQKFRWIHFPEDPKEGTYVYRVTKQHMPSSGKLVAGTSITLDIPLNSVIYDNFLDLGFTRNFASSQAYVEKFGNNANVIPVHASDSFKFAKVPGDVYEWLGFEAYEMIFGFLDEVVKDTSLTLDVFAYDLSEPDIVKRLEAIKGRLRIIIDNSGEHGPASSGESQSAKFLAHSAGARNVKRMHFIKLQHNKVFIAKRDGKPVKVLFGSTNFSFRGLYVQANNAMIVHAPEAAELFETAFDVAFKDPKSFPSDPISRKWHLVQVAEKPVLHFCLSPHESADLSMNPVAGAIDQATSSVLFAIAFLYQTKSGPVRNSINRLMKKNVFSYGISDKKGSLDVKKPDGSIGLVKFAYLAKNAPEPFASEWSGGAGIHEHDKFVVTDFNLPTAKVFTGSSNLSPSGEEGNGDNLVMIEDQKIATSYAIEAIRIFDHLQFRSRMQDALAKKQKSPSKPLILKKPTAISGKPAWFEDFYKEGSQAENDRKLFSH